MSYTLDVIRSQEQTTSTWSGGTTTQIAIFPPDALYSERTFKWRLSSATVEVEESVFTSLPGIKRIIMVLTGEMKLEHVGHHTVTLKPFEQDSFLGDWTTKSFGKVRDFNLMLGPDCSGQLNAIAIEPQSSQTVTIATSRSVGATSAFYCLNGRIGFAVNKKDTCELISGDILLIHTKASGEERAVTMSNLGNALTHIIHADIAYT